MASFSVPNAVVAAFPAVTKVVDTKVSTTPTVSPDTGTSQVDISASSVMVYPSYSGGGPIRPSTGQVYPRGL
jgi:hypothetical protein